MGQVKIYIDEDAMDSDLAAALRSTHECVLNTFNVCDFYRIHIQWINAGREHAYMILAPRQRFSVGEQLRRLLRLRTAMSTANMRNRAEFLGSWG